MDILNTINTVKVSGSSGSSVKKISEKSKWQLTDSLKEKIVELAKKDAKNNVYMGNEFMNLRKAEVTKVAPNRAALIGKFNQSMSSENMGDMKGDMAGGATVLGAISAISKLKLDVNIIGLIPCVENMPSGHAYRPGDVISSMSKKTIEIISTDAEGRLILADAISYAKKLGVNQIIDVATLTGACVVALGNITSGIISNNSNLCKKVLDSAEEAGEKMWEFPHFEEYKELIKSDIADLKNSGGKWGGAITAGLFLGEFAMDTPWVHIDIAGTSDIAKDKNYQSKGATGVGVRTLIYLAQTLYDDC